MVHDNTDISQWPKRAKTVNMVITIDMNSGRGLTVDANRPL